MPGTSMTAHNVGSNTFSMKSDSSNFSLGRSIITSHSAMKFILEDLSERDQEIKEKLEFLNS